jgi:outer membrane receptor protein involved in Fe transport
VYDVSNTATPDVYRTAQSGWYVQGVYQFAPRWRAGLRFDQLNSGTIEADSKPKRSSVMLDWSLSEFSKIRMQYSHDQSRVDTSDRQLFVQYQMNLGAHGAHSF